MSKASLFKSFGDSRLDNNFSTLEELINSNILFRLNIDGEPNQLEQELDMNSNDINNVRRLSASTIYLGGTPVVPVGVLTTDDDKLSHVDDGDPGTVSYEIEKLKAYPRTFDAVSGVDPEARYLVDASDLRVGDTVETLGYSIAGDGGGNVYEIVPAGTGTDDGGSFIDLISLGLQAKAVISGTVSPATFGVLPSSADNSDAWQALLNTSPAHVHFSVPGVYKFLSSSTHSASINITSVPGVIIDCTSPVFSGGWWTKFSGSLQQIQNLGANAVKGERIVVFDSEPTLEPNDVFIIFNPAESSWSTFRTNYFAGEFCRVGRTSASTALISGGLYDDYAIADVNVYRLDAIIVNISGLTVNGDVSTSLIDLEFCRDSLLLNIKSNHKHNSCITVQRSYNCAIIEPSIFNGGYGGDDYGIAITNSQTIRITGGDIYSRRHPITTGGDANVCAVPCRDLRFSNITLSNDITSGTHCADFHGNTEDSQYVNCEIYGGATWQGKNNGYVNCRIGSILAGPCILSSEILEGELYAINCRFHSVIDPSTGSRGIIDAGGNSSPIDTRTIGDVTLSVKGGSIFGRNIGATASLMTVENRGSTHKINVEVSDIEIDVDSYQQVLFTRLNSGTADSDFIIVDNLKSRGGPATVFLANHNASSYTSFPHRMQKQSGQEQLTTSTSAPSVQGTPVVYKWIYPRNPNVVMSRTNKGYVGNRIGIALAATATATGLTPSIATDDATNFPVSESIDVNWSATIDEL